PHDLQQPFKAPDRRLHFGSLRVSAGRFAPRKPRDAGTPGRRDAGTPGRRDAGTPGRRDAGTPGRRDAGTPGRRDAVAEDRPLQSSAGRFSEKTSTLWARPFTRWMPWLVKELRRSGISRRKSPETRRFAPRP